MGWCFGPRGRGRRESSGSALRPGRSIDDRASSHGKRGARTVDPMRVTCSQPALTEVEYRPVFVPGPWDQNRTSSGIAVSILMGRGGFLYTARRDT